jgi:hypothetical protein
MVPRGAPTSRGNNSATPVNPYPAQMRSRRSRCLEDSPAPATNQTPRPPVGQKVWAATGVIITVSSRPSEKRGARG